MRNISQTFRESYPMYIAEFIGTLLYSMTFAITTYPIKLEIPDLTSININESYFIAPLAVGFIVIAMIYAFGHISGGHFNPAITLAVLIRKFITPIDAMFFLLVQFSGAFAGAFLAYAITYDLPYIEPYVDPSTKEGIEDFRCVLVEAIYSFAICIVVINVATTDSQSGNYFYGVSIGMTVAAGLAASQKISGGCFNPALGTALSVTNSLRDEGTIEHIWIYIVSPLIGAVIAGYSFYVVNVAEVEEAAKMVRQSEMRQEIMQYQ